MSDSQHSIPALTARHPITLAIPLLPGAKSSSALLTTLRAHQTMLTDLYVAQNNAYVVAYTEFETQYATATRTTSPEMQEVIARLLGEQKEVMLFQTLLWSFQMFVAGLESSETHDLDEGQAREQEGFGSGGTRGFEGMWR
ncbi:hypothetical protein J4E86_001113 [Alternaria arbusti]|uniref:uncharacterized protein n=1 Tax=Alternaria arbusti TaxID=232088 RepID=UPI00221E924E|nr:uncharacterized protein J4E86_001113 [Alternaria arbusti]KAI4962081.1 hypothetical protein J4E86_001113 [Alternaria arbusti]